MNERKECEHEVFEEINGIVFCISCGLETGILPCREYSYEGVSRRAPTTGRRGPTREQRLFEEVRKLEYGREAAELSVSISPPKGRVREILG